MTLHTTENMFASPSIENIQTRSRIHFSRKKQVFAAIQDQVPVPHQSSSFDHVPIGRHGLTAGWLLDQIPNCFDRTSIKKIKAEQLGTEGFVSQIVRVNVQLDSERQHSVIVKMPDTTKIRIALEKTTGAVLPDGADDKFIHGLNMFFNREIEFYNMSHIPHLLLPYILHQQPWTLGDKNGAIVMEDLCEMVSVPYFDSLNLEQVECVGAQLQALHHYSLDMDEKWAEKFAYPMELIDTVSNMEEIVTIFVERNPTLSSLFSKLLNIYRSGKIFVRLLRDSHKELGMKDVLCHGDLWSYNLMWHKNKASENSPSNILGKVIDWQNVHVGSIGEDFAHLLAFNCDVDVRKKAEKEYLPKYFEQIRVKAILAKKPFEFTDVQFMRAYRRQFVAHALHLPFIAYVMLRVKPATDEAVQRKMTERLVERTKHCWEDALKILQEEYPDLVLTR